MLDLPPPSASPRRSGLTQSPLCTPTSVGLALDAWGFTARLAAQLQPSVGPRTLRVGSAHVHLTLGIHPGGRTSFVEMAEPGPPVYRGPFYTLHAYMTVPEVEAWRPTPTGLRPALRIRQSFDRADPPELREWAVSALRLCDVDWVTLDGDTLAWA